MKLDWTIYSTTVWMLYVTELCLILFLALYSTHYIRWIKLKIIPLIDITEKDLIDLCNKYIKIYKLVRLINYIVFIIVILALFNSILTR